MEALFVVFGRLSLLTSIVVALIYIPTDNIEGRPLPHSLPSMVTTLSGLR